MRGGRQRAQRGRDLETEVSLSFRQAIDGAQIQVSLPMSGPCSACGGSGAAPGTSPTVCPQCQGRGIESQGQGPFSISHPCSRCGGAGQIIERPCPRCGGTGEERSLKKLRVNVPAGVRDGSRIRIAGKGEVGMNGGPAGDLYVVTHVAPSPVFKRKGANLEVEVPLTLAEALRGGVIEVPTLNGTKKLKIPAGTEPGAAQRLKGEGPPRLAGRGHGDIHYRFTLELPKKLTKTQQEAIDQLAKTMNGNPRERLLKDARA